ncbi:hypothetical protein EDC04DRAFT_2644475 [Pisolithus marmoratus]|nr:hypothetical protein EDC04DRAFT_2787983 [Pisolithus marmoratus]KAI6044340.1 hypothetical protein EDC04DRAFT_2644475 [Pisolithus marmoratus]
MSSFGVSAANPLLIFHWIAKSALSMTMSASDRWSMLEALPSVRECCLVTDPLSRTRTRSGMEGFVIKMGGEFQASEMHQ